MTVLIGLLVLYSILYLSMITAFIIGWLSLPEFKPSAINNQNISNIFVSVVVAVRNEEKKITTLLNALACQHFPKSYFEVIIVDDHSTDSTRRIIEEFCNSYTNFHLIRQSKNYTGKKAAISNGVTVAKGQLIATTDADCSMGNNWLKTIASFYAEHKPQMIVAPVMMQSNTLFEKFQALEFISLISSGAGAIGARHPVMCNGANLIYEKQAYVQASLALEHETASGDDVFLMLELKRQKQKIMFLKSREAVVQTSAQPTLKAFVEQRKRWVSKSSKYQDFDIKFIAVIVFLINVLLVFSLTGSIFYSDLLWAFVIFFMLKSIPDFVLLFLNCRYFGKMKLLWFFLPVQFLYPFYVLWVAVTGLAGNFSWKGRGYRR